jgi:hypothetical protein
MMKKNDNDVKRRRLVEQFKRDTRSLAISIRRFVRKYGNAEKLKLKIPIADEDGEVSEEVPFDMLATAKTIEFLSKQIGEEEGRNRDIDYIG